MRTIQVDHLTAWTTRLLHRWGYAAADAEYLADTLVDANLCGVDSHGVIRLAAYHRRIEAGLVDPTAQPEVRVDRGVVQVDARGTAGQLAARAATEAVATAARTHGVASATVRASAHFGMAGYYARNLARQGFVAMVVSNSEPIVVPFGGRSPLFGTNPFAFAAPGDPPLSLDMATSTAAAGKILLAQSENRPIPPDWGVDADGRPTTDPAKVVSLYPFGGPKGYGIAFLVEVLAGVLSGAAVSRDIGNMYQDFSKPQNVGHWMLALDVSAHMPLADFTKRLADLVRLAHATPAAPGFDSVLVPGEPEQRTREERRIEGIPLGNAVVAELADLGARFDEPFVGEGDA